MSDDGTRATPDAADAADDDRLEVLPPVDRLEVERILHPLPPPPEEEVAIRGEGDSVVLERTLTAQLRLLYGALIPMAGLWSWVVWDISGRVTVRGLDGWVFGEASVVGTTLGIAVVPWIGLALLWHRARRDHGRCVLRGDLAVMEAPLGWGRLGRVVVSRADVVAWKETPVGFHLSYRGEPGWVHWTVPTFVPAWSPRRRAAARQWLEGSGEVQPLRHLAPQPRPGRGLAYLLGGLVVAGVLCGGILARYELTSPGRGERYPAARTLLTGVGGGALLGMALLLVPAWRRRRRVALVDDELLIGERLVPSASFTRVALADGLLAIEDQRRRRWALELPATDASAEALRRILPRGVPLDGALPTWANGRLRRTCGFGLLGLCLWLCLGNPPLYGARVYKDASGQQLHVVYRLSDRAPAFVAVLEDPDARGSFVPGNALWLTRIGLQGGVRAHWAGALEPAVVDLNARVVTLPETESEPLPAGANLLLWRPGSPAQVVTADLPPGLVRRIDELDVTPAGGSLALPVSGSWDAAAVRSLDEVWTVADLLAATADWDGTLLEPIASGDGGTRTHLVEDGSYAMMWRARGANLRFLAIVPRSALNRLNLDYRGIPSFGGRLLPRVARVRFGPSGTGLEVLEGSAPRVDTLSVVTDDVRRGRPLAEAARALLPDLWDGR